MHSSHTYKEYQGKHITDVPELSGLYAWYYRPIAYNRDSIVQTLTRFLSEETSISTTITQRYGLRVISHAFGTTYLGADKQAIPEALDDAFSDAEPFLLWFFQSEQFVHFCRPIYIGIAKNLYERVYNQHYTSLIEYWDPASRMSKFFSSHPKSTVQQVMDNLDIPHSFALEARVRGIQPRDLMVSVLLTDQIPLSFSSDSSGIITESIPRRSLERLLQLLSDPICGRR